MRCMRTVTAPAGTPRSVYAPASLVTVPIAVPTTVTCAPGTPRPVTESTTVPCTVARPGCGACAGCAHAARGSAGDARARAPHVASPTNLMAFLRGWDDC